MSAEIHAVVELYATQKRLVEVMTFTGRLAPEQAHIFAESQGEVVLSGTVFQPGDAFLSIAAGRCDLFVPDGDLHNLRLEQPDATADQGFSQQQRIFLVRLSQEKEAEIFGNETLETRAADRQDEDEDEIVDRVMRDPHVRNAAIEALVDQGFVSRTG